jgi:SAM-dependent methyltransferase
MTATRTEKSSTDVHWDVRAAAEQDRRKVNIDDLVQRKLENDFIFQWIKPADRLLEVGCGNGFLTEELRKRVQHVTGFDFSEQMIAGAKSGVGETNNSFFVGSVLSPTTVKEKFDCIVCVRVLINLSGLMEQLAAIRNMHEWLKPNGRLILVEGYLDGFESLNELRRQCGVQPLSPAKINFYSKFGDVSAALAKDFNIAGEWHSGMFDVLTRVAYPLLVGSSKASGPSDFHEKIAPLASTLNPSEFTKYARLRGLALTRR